MTYTIDAKNKRLGRVASEIAQILQGKKHPSYQKNIPGDDVVIVKQAGQISVTGGKEKKKVYYRHTGYMGHLRQKTYEQVWQKSPAEVLRRAVYNMLPKNWLRQKRMNRLKIEV